MARRKLPYKCRCCGETDPKQFNATYKSLCAGCRCYNERLRYWHAQGLWLNYKPV